MNGEVAVIILNYNTWQRTLEAVEMLHQLLEVASDDIYVIDNASSNASYQQLQKCQSDSYQLLRAEANAGYAAGNNIGLRYVREQGYHYAWILNNDIVIKDNKLLRKMLSVLKKDQKLAVVNPDIYAPDGHLFNRESKRPTFWDFTFGMFHYRRIGRQLNNRGGYGYVYRPQGCCMLLDLEKVKEAGDLDERTFLYGEEVILAERLLRKGYLCACCPGISVLHNHSTTVKNVYTRKKVIHMKLESFRYYLRAYRHYSALKTEVTTWFYRIKFYLLEL